MSVMDLAMRNSQALGVVLSSRVVNPAVTLLQGATGYWDVANYTSGSQTLPNRGTGGTALDAQLGSTSSVADSNDPQYLPYSGTPYVYLPGVAGNYLSAPDVALDAADLDLIVRVAPDDWTPSAIGTLISKSVATTAINFRLNTDGTLYLRVQSGAGANVDSTSSVATGFVDGSAAWLRVTFDGDNGASGSTCKFYTAADSSTVPTSWTQLGTDRVGAVQTVRDNADNFEFGTISSGALTFAGKFYRAIVRNGIGGTTVLDVDTSVLTSGSATSFTALTGQTVTINRSSSGRKAVAVVKPVMLFGTDDYLRVSDNDLLDFAAAESFSLVWFGRIWGTATAATQIIGKQAGVSGAANPGYLLIATAGGAFQLRVKDGTNNVATTASTYTSGASSFYAGVLNGTTGTTWLNGVAAASTSTAIVTGTLANSYTMDIGVDAAVFGDFEWQTAAVFRRALSASEISILATYAASRMP